MHEKCILKKVHDMKNARYTLHEKCPHFPAFVLNTERYLCGRENADHNNSKYGYFLRSDSIIHLVCTQFFPKN